MIMDLVGRVSPGTWHTRLESSSNLSRFDILLRTIHTNIIQALILVTHRDTLFRGLKGDSDMRGWTYFTFAFIADATNFLAP